MRRTLHALVGLSLILSSACVSTPHKAATRTCFHESDSVETEIGYCSAVRSGQMLYISGSGAKGGMASAIPDQTHCQFSTRAIIANGNVPDTTFEAPSARAVTCRGDNPARGVARPLASILMCAFVQSSAQDNSVCASRSVTSGKSA